MVTKCIVLFKVPLNRKVELLNRVRNPINGTIMQFHLLSKIR